MRSNAVSNERLFWALAEQLKIPLMQIARSAEGRTSIDVLTGVQTTAELTLRLIDSYLLSSEIGQLSLHLQPVSVPLVLQEAAHQLTPHAKRYGCELVVEFGSKNELVMSNKDYLQSAFLALGFAFIESNIQTKKSQIIMGTHNSLKGVVAGVFGDNKDLDSTAYKKAGELYGSARQPLSNVLSGSGASIFIADTILQSIARPLQVARHHKMSGLATTLLPSQQLELIV